MFKKILTTILLLILALSFLILVILSWNSNYNYKNDYKIIPGIILCLISISIIFYTISRLKRKFYKKTFLTLIILWFLTIIYSLATLYDCSQIHNKSDCNKNLLCEYYMGDLVIFLGNDEFFHPGSCINKLPK